MRTPYREFGSLVILTPAWSPRKLCKIEYKTKRLLIESGVAPRALCDSSPLKAQTKFGSHWERHAAIFDEIPRDCTIAQSKN